MYEYSLEAPHTIRRIEKDIPEPGTGEILIRVHNIGICGSDIHLYNGNYSAPHRYPILFGHEWSGEVEKIGPGVSRIKKGAYVTGDCSRYCGHCSLCKIDKNLCEHIEKFGITIDGSSREYMVRDEKYVYCIEEGIDRDLVCLSEPVAVAAHLIGKMRCICSNLPEKRILIMGGGVIGMAIMMLLKYMNGCKQVELFDISKHRTRIAASSGSRIPDVAELETGGENASYMEMYAAAKYDAIIETTGVASVFTNSIKLLKPTGILGCVGMIASVEFPQKQIVTKSLTIIGSIGGTGDFDTAVRFISEYPAEAKKLISHRYSVNDMEEAFKTAMKPDEAMKVVLTL
jgi:2-desacetyl-2-hydroxyethyl bacteriochlorophyllide A dehydrogenase